MILLITFPTFNNRLMSRFPIFSKLNDHKQQANVCSNLCPTLLMLGEFQSALECAFFVRSCGEKFCDNVIFINQTTKSLLIIFRAWNVVVSISLD